MKVLIVADDLVNAYIPSLINAYKNKGCEVIIGVTNFYQSNWIPEIIHLQWPESLYKFGDFSLYGDAYITIKERFIFYKSQGVKFLWTIHNLKPHDSVESELDSSIYRLFAENADIIIHHGHASVELIKDIYPIVNKKQNIICPHGDYQIQYKNIDRLEARRILNLPSDKIILLNFGMIRGYKGLNLIPQIFKGWKEKKKFLFTAGMFQLDYNLKSVFFRVWRGYLRKRTNHYGYDINKIKNSDLPLYFSAADVVVLAHTKGLTSGLIPMAVTFNKPIIYPKIGNFDEQSENSFSEGYEPGNVKSAIDALNKIVTRMRCYEKFDNSVWLEKNSWDKHVSNILDSVSLLKGKSSEN